MKEISLSISIVISLLLSGCTLNQDEVPIISSISGSGSSALTGTLADDTEKENADALQRSQDVMTFVPEVSRIGISNIENLSMYISYGQGGLGKNWCSMQEAMSCEIYQDILSTLSLHDSRAGVFSPENVESIGKVGSWGMRLGFVGNIEYNGVVGFSQNSNPTYTGSTYNLPILSYWEHGDTISIPSIFSGSLETIIGDGSSISGLSAMRQEGIFFTSTGILLANSVNNLGKNTYIVTTSSPQSTWNGSENRIRIDLSKVQEITAGAKQGKLEINLHIKKPSIREAYYTNKANKKVSLNIVRGAPLDTPTAGTVYFFENQGESITRVYFLYEESIVKNMNNIEFLYN